MKPRAALLMLLPAVGFFVLTFVAPLVIVLRLSVFQSDYVTETFVGVGNYINAVRDPYFQKSFVNAFVLTLMNVPLLVTLAYWIASTLSGYPLWAQSLGRMAVFLPSLVTGVIMALVWRWLLQREGLLNATLATLHLPGLPWLTETWPARAAVSAIQITATIGGAVIMFAASMHGISPELKDAALIDGADERLYKRHVVRPLMLPTILLVVLVYVVGIMQITETMYVLFPNGGPEGSTATPAYEIFMTAFLFGKQGLAAAKGLLLTLVIVAILALKQRAERWVR